MNERLEAVINECNVVNDKRLGQISKYSMINNLETIKNLKSENAKLRKEKASLIKEVERLEKENAKLANKYKNNSTTASKEYKEFRKKVLERDNYKCVKCGAKDNLQVHHIKPKKDYPDLIMNFDNVQTLCLLCHSKTDSYLKK